MNLSYLLGRLTCLAINTGGIRKQLMKIWCTYSKRSRALLGMFIFLLVGGAVALAIPFLFVRQIPQGLTEEEKLAAEYAIFQVRQSIGGSLESVIALRLEVASLQESPGRSSIYLSIPGKGIRSYTFSRTYVATVNAVTFFGSRYSRFLVICDEAPHRGGIKRLP